MAPVREPDEREQRHKDMNDPVLPEELPSPTWNAVAESPAPPALAGARSRRGSVSDRSLGLMAAAALAVGGVAFAGLTQTSDASITVPLVGASQFELPVNEPVAVPTAFVDEVPESVPPAVAAVLEEPGHDWDDCPGCGMG